MKMSTPSVTVVMAAYNASNFIEKAIVSLQKQSLRDWELIVVDDCSSDNTGAAVQNMALADDRIMYKRMAENKGPAAARNVGLALARGEWITILDSDDRYDPDRLRYMADKAVVLQADVLVDNLYCYDELIDKIVRVAFKVDGDNIPLTTERLVANDGPPRIFSCGMMKPFIRRQYLQETGIVYDEDIKVGEDFGLLFDLLGQGATAYILGKAGYIYTLPFGTKSRQKSTGSRTDYNDKGWQRLIATNDRLLKKVQSGFKDNKPIIGLLLERKLRFTREKAWQEVKQLTAQRKIMPALKLVVRGNLLPHLWERSVNRFKASQAII